MIAKLHTVAAVFLLAVLAFLGGAAAGLPAAAATHAPSSHTSLWWDSLTCHAFASDRFHLMVVASREADPYLETDVHLWAHDLKDHAPRTVTALDRSYVAVDCTQTGDGSPA